MDQTIADYKQLNQWSKATQIPLACVQTSPLPQEKSGEETLSIFPEGVGTSVHRLGFPFLLNISL